MATKPEDLRKKLAEIVDDPKATTGNRLKAIELLSKIGDPQSVDQQIVEQIIREEQERLRTLSDDQLRQYADLLQSPDMDREFATMVEYRRRGVQYFPERSRSGTATTLKPVRKKKRPNS